MKPQLATLVDGVPRHGVDWLYEVKFDGYRMLARVEGSRVQMFTRNGHDWSDKVPHLVTSIRHLNVGSAWIDGEIVILADNGVPSFQALQNAFDGKRTANIVLYAFDLPFIAGRDIPGGTASPTPGAAISAGRCRPGRQRAFQRGIPGLTR